MSSLKNVGIRYICMVSLKHGKVFVFIANVPQWPRQCLISLAHNIIPVDSTNVLEFSQSFSYDDGIIVPKL